jgi:hypothetical protein
LNYRRVREPKETVYTPTTTLTARPLAKLRQLDSSVTSGGALLARPSPGDIDRLGSHTEKKLGHAKLLNEEARLRLLETRYPAVRG